MAIKNKRKQNKRMTASMQAAEADTVTLDSLDGELAERINERRRAHSSVQRRRKILTILAIIIAFAMLASMCGRDIIRLKAENRELKQQQLELEKKRDELKEELENTGKQEYIRDQAKKQLRLLNPGEILFTFDDDEETEDGGTDD